VLNEEIGGDGLFLNQTPTRKLKAGHTDKGNDIHQERDKPLAAASRSSIHIILYEVIDLSSIRSLLTGDQLAASMIALVHP
jgi:hypothetical protein